MTDLDLLLESHEGLVREVAFRLGREHDDDALQHGRIGLWEAAKAWDGVRPFEPLARRCIRNNIIDYARRKVPKEDELTDDLAGEQPPDEESTEELLKRICAIFPRRSRERKVLVSMLHGKDKKAIARRLGVSERTVDRAARRAMERLNKEKQEP